MSTRANIMIKDSQSELTFYRHSDGYPSGTMPTLAKFLDKVKSGKIRNNVDQASGWLIVIGHEEYKNSGCDWKVGAYEPTTCIHSDIEYLYEIDLDALTIRCWTYNNYGKGVEEDLSEWTGVKNFEKATKKEDRVWVYDAAGQKIYVKYSQTAKRYYYVYSGTTMPWRWSGITKKILDGSGSYTEIFGPYRTNVLNKYNAFSS